MLLLKIKLDIFICFVSEFLLSMIIYQRGRRDPFSILEILIAHHTPFSPRELDDSIRAVGILKAFKLMLVTDGGMVLPKPLKAPAVTASVHINNWDNPNILR